MTEISLQKRDLLPFIGRVSPPSQLVTGRAVCPCATDVRIPFRRMKRMPVRVTVRYRDDEV